MKHRPFSELTKDWSPERKARVAAMTAQLVDELEAEKRERRRSQALDGPAAPGPPVHGSADERPRRNAPEGR